jgi:gamma-glutamylcysteine synthetase
MTTVFPEARAKKFIEMRGADAAIRRISRAARVLGRADV